MRRLAEYTRNVTAIDATKGGVASRTARVARQVEGSNKPHRILWSYCKKCVRGYYFFDIRKFPLKRNEAARIEPGMIKVMGMCIECHTYSTFYSDAEELAENRYGPIESCFCGLPLYHLNPPRHLIQAYNMNSVPCRPRPTNGHQ